MNKIIFINILSIAMFVLAIPATIKAEEICKEGETENCISKDNLKNADNNSSSSVQTQIDTMHTDVAKLKQHNEDREFAELKADAETAITSEVEEDDDQLKLKTFRGGERSLQALNPEISIVGDLFARAVNQNGEIYSSNANGAQTGFFPRVLGLHFQSNLDPFSFTKMVIGITPNGVSFGEAYITWNSVTSRLSLTFGKFHQQFGVVNRWHVPGLDQFSYPLVLEEHFGGALNQTGVAAVILMPPMWADVMELEIQITNGQNGKLFSGDFFSIPTGLVHLRNYWDLSRDTYLELGFSGIIGVNNSWGKPVAADPQPVQLFDEDGSEVTFYDADGNQVNTVFNSGDPSILNDDDWLLSVVGGANLTLSWEPVNAAKYKSFTWRTEFLYAYKEVSSNSAINSWGAYSYMQYKPIRNWIFGVRGDLTQPFILENKDKFTWGVVPYITWWQSPWVRFRLEYDQIHWYQGNPEHRAMLQVTFSVGPHKHERY